MVKRCFLLVLIPFLLTSCSQKAKQQVDRNDQKSVATVGKLPATLVSPPAVEVVDAKTLAVEGKHKPFNEMTDAETKVYYNNRVSIPFSPDIKARSDGSPYEVMQYYLRAAKSENYKQCSACLSKNASKMFNEITDDLMGELHHKKSSYSIEEQCYNTGRTYIEDYKNKREIVIWVEIWSPGSPHHEFKLIRQKNVWRIQSIEFSAG